MIIIMSEFVVMVLLFSVFAAVYTRAIGDRWRWLNAH